MNFSGVYQRENRNPSQMYHPMHNSVASYWTEALQKNEMKHDFGDEIFLNNIHLIPDPLKKNLADTLFTTDLPKKMNKTFLQETTTHQNQKVPLKTQNMSEKTPREANQSTTLGGIGSFFSGVLNVLTSAMFRSRSPVNYYDCCDDGYQGSPHIWQPAKTDEQDKNGQADDRKSYDAPSNPNVSSDMNFDSRSTVTNCESKLNQVLHLLTPKQTSSPVWVRKRPKKVFVEPNSVGDSFEDAFTPEDFGSHPDDSYIEYYSPVQYHCPDLHETAAQKTKLNMAPIRDIAVLKDTTSKSDLELKKNDSQMEKVSEQSEKHNVQMEMDNVLLEKDNSKQEQGNVQLDEKEFLMEKEQLLESKPALLEMDKADTENPGNKHELVSSCEDKLSKLKLLLREKRMKCKAKREGPEASPPKTIPAEKNRADKHYKNPKKRCSKRQKSKLKCRIEDDLVFANEINLGTPPHSIENSPMQHTNVNFGDYFDEVSGRFRSASIGSEDSFQIVFNDCPKQSRIRTISDCDSEDSFIIFEESPESCYMSNDVFGESEDSDSESEMSDSGCGMMTCKLAHNLSRTISNLADDSLYVESEDEVDFAQVETVSDVVEERKSGLLIDDKKKLMRKCQPPKTVHFSTDPPKVHVLRVWAFAARQARAGHWERFAVDRERFKRRIADVDMAVSWVLKPQHRRRVMFQRFMPWWNQLKRKELAEKKEREAEEKRKEEERKNAEDRLEADNLAFDFDDANINESNNDLEDEGKNKSHGEQSGSVNIESKDSVTRETDDSQNRNAGDVGVQDELRRGTITEDCKTATKGDKKLEFNNNRIFDCEHNSEKIPSKLVTQNEVDKSKIQVK